MNTITKTSTADEAWAAHQEEKTFALVAPRLQSLTESHTERICPGYLDQGCVNGGDEVEPGDDICSGCIREEERFYQREMQERDCRDSEAASSQYAHLHADRVEALRAIRDGQIEIVKAIDAGKAAA